MPSNQAPQPLISVALSVYNGERHLREQLDSVLAQEGVQLEIVAVDDGSSDGSVALLREYAQRDPRIQVHVNPKNLGHLRSFERAMSLCHGEFIAPCDQDDVWHPDKLARLLAAIGDADLAYCDSEYIDEQGASLHRRISQDLPMHAGMDPLRYIFQNTVSGHACLLRRKLLERAGPAPALLYHDWWLAMCAAAHAGVVYVDAPLVSFRRHVAAFSPLGKKHEANARLSKKERRARNRGSVNRKWIAERLYVARMLGETDWHGSAAARDWFTALQQAVDGNSKPLFQVIWRDRMSVPPWRGMAWINALKFYKRCKRKIRHGRREPEPSTPLFRA
ncbi:MAG: glycosyltransferase family 2 protein [Lysobacter sp.]|nr:glycosyltransferase family 2 protein [Lysobacter sp.]